METKYCQRFYMYMYIKLGCLNLPIPYSSSVQCIKNIYIGVTNSLGIACSK